MKWKQSLLGVLYYAFPLRGGHAAPPWHGRESTTWTVQRAQATSGLCNLARKPSRTHWASCQWQSCRACWESFPPETKQQWQTIRNVSKLDDASSTHDFRKNRPSQIKERKQQEPLSPQSNANTAHIFSVLRRRLDKIGTRLPAQFGGSMLGKTPVRMEKGMPTLCRRNSARAARQTPAFGRRL